MTTRRERYQNNLMHAGKAGVSEKRRFSMSKTRRVSLSIPLIDTRRMSHIIPHADESPSTAGHTPLYLLLQRNIVLALKVRLCGLARVHAGCFHVFLSFFSAIMIRDTFSTKCLGYFAFFSTFHFRHIFDIRTAASVLTYTS